MEQPSATTTQPGAGAFSSGFRGHISPHSSDAAAEVAAAAAGAGAATQTIFSPVSGMIESSAQTKILEITCTGMVVEQATYQCWFGIVNRQGGDRRRGTIWPLMELRFAD